jgi:hypothetical protein
MALAMGKQWVSNAIREEREIKKIEAENFSVESQMLV